MNIEHDMAATLRAQTHDHEQIVLFEAAAFNGGQGAKARSIAWSTDITPPLKSVPSGSNAIPDVVYRNTGYGKWYEADICETLRTPCGGDSTKANLIIERIRHE